MSIYLYALGLKTPPATAATRWHTKHQGEAVIEIKA
jgi:hypothetical protein